MQTDESCIGTQANRVRDKIAPHGNVEYAMFGDGLLNRGRIVGYSVALDSQGLQIDPCFRGRQRGDDVSRWRRQLLDRMRIEAGQYLARINGAVHRKSVREGFHLITLARSGNCFSALAQQRKGLYLSAENPLQIDFGAR